VGKTEGGWGKGIFAHFFSIPIFFRRHRI